MLVHSCHQSSVSHSGFVRSCTCNVAGTITGHFRNGTGRAQCKLDIMLHFWGLIKNSKNVFALAVLFVCGTGRQPHAALPTADSENAVTVSAVTIVCSSLFQSAVVLMNNEIMYCSVST